MQSDCFLTMRVYGILVCSIVLTVWGCVPAPHPTYRRGVDTALRTINEFHRHSLNDPKELDDFEEGIRFLLETDPHDPRLYDALGIVAYRRGDLSRAEVEFRKAELLDPQYVRAQVNRANVYFARSELNRAEAVLQRILVVAPSEYQAYRLLEAICTRRKDADCARKYNLRSRLLMEGKIAQ